MINLKVTTKNKRMIMKEIHIVNTQREQQNTSKQGFISASLILTIVLCNPINNIVPFIPGVSAAETTAEQMTFKTADAAVDSLLAALKKGDLETLLDIFGREYEEKLIGGDPIASREARKQASVKAQEMHKLRDDGKDKKILLIGSEAWPVPFPLVMKDGSWSFDTAAGIEEVVNRRIGKNELNAIDMCRAFINGQYIYASADHDGDEVLEFAQKIASTIGKKDGLFWESREGEELSPFGPLVADASDYLEGREPGDPFKGYYYKIITRQGTSAPGKRYDYIINDNMIAGFATIAFPADHGNSGIMTFMCSHQGKVYQKNFGEDSDLIAAGIDEYNPDDSWSEVEN
jgi:Protein of unknown function (DUF2950)